MMTLSMAFRLYRMRGFQGSPRSIRSFAHLVHFCSSAAGIVTCFVNAFPRRARDIIVLLGLLCPWHCIFVRMLRGKVMIPTRFLAGAVPDGDARAGLRSAEFWQQALSCSRNTR
jgi:hypothetical protein